MSRPAYCIVFHLIVAMVLVCPIVGAAADRTRGPAHLIPLPVSMAPQDGVFVITASTRVVAEGRAGAEASKLIEALAPAMGHRLQRAEGPSGAPSAIHLALQPALESRCGAEGYTLEVTPRAIVIQAAQSAGLFYGIQTLRQLLPPAIFSRQKVEGIAWTVPCVVITDYPLFKWRGLLIDPARHFIPQRDVKRFIDAMAIHKFNRLQIHLTDDTGWRIEIKKYPELTKTGARMDFTTLFGGGDKDRPGADRVRGFYTQDDMRELIRYAAERHITILPEIEMPAHTGAAIVSYPRIGLHPEKLANLPAAERWLANERVLAPRPQTVAFMQDVLTEIMDVFPSKYIHIGGDEANMDHWKQSEEMLAMMRRRDLKDVAELHSWFIKEMDTFLARHGRRLVGWDEILQGGLAPGAVVMSWRGQDGGITAAQAGHDVIMAPTSHTYFDYYQGKQDTEPRAIGGYIPLETAYSFEPVPPALNAEQAEHVLGGQGQLWGEFIATRGHLDYMTWPRAAALAEIIWSPKTSRDYQNFLTRLRPHLERFRAMDIRFRELD